MANTILYVNLGKLLADTTYLIQSNKVVAIYYYIRAAHLTSSASSS